VVIFVETVAHAQGDPDPSRQRQPGSMAVADLIESAQET
jgi:hypothetical protein